MVQQSLDEAHSSCVQLGERLPMALACFCTVASVTLS